MSVSVDFQKRINELVEDSGILKSNLPKLIGIDYRSYSNALNYGIIPKPRVLVRIADYFEVSLKYLLGQSDDDSFCKATVASSFNERFINLCRNRGLTYYKVSMDCHFDKSYISRWLNKNYLPSLELLEILADYFNVSLDYLLGRTEEL